jgi:hypothetical protein
VSAVDTRPSGHHRRAATVPDAPRTPPPCPPAAAARRAADTLVWTAARVCCRRRHRLRRLASTAVAGGACMDGRPPATAMSAPCSGAAAAAAAESGRPASTWPQSRTSSGHRGGVRSRGRPWVAGQVGAAGRHRRSERSDSGRGLRPPATRRRPAPWTPATAAGAGGHCGSGLLDSRQPNRPLPLACPARNGTARCGIGQHRHGQTTRSVDRCSRSIWSAPDGSGLLTLDGSSIWSDPDGSRRIVWMINRMIKRLGRCLAIRGATSAQGTRF